MTEAFEAEINKSLFVLGLGSSPSLIPASR